MKPGPQLLPGDAAARAGKTKQPRVCNINQTLHSLQGQRIVGDWSCFTCLQSPPCPVGHGRMSPQLTLRNGFGSSTWRGKILCPSLRLSCAIIDRLCNECSQHGDAYGVTFPHFCSLCAPQGPCSRLCRPGAAQTQAERGEPDFPLADLPLCGSSSSAQGSAAPGTQARALL